MKPISETQAVLELDRVRSAFREDVRRSYEHRAKPCSTCETPGACCLDAHFVNVRITRLEATAIGRVLDTFEPDLRARVMNRARGAVREFRLDDPRDDDAKTYACPLYEKGTGCLVHQTAKPLPCIAHACYERVEDLPPDELLAVREAAIGRLNRRVYGRTDLRSIPLWLVQKREKCR